jgi:hypothetical protein
MDVNSQDLAYMQPQVSAAQVDSRCLNLRHPHWKTVYHHMGVEGFEDIAGKQAMINARVFVLLEFRQLVLANVDHRECCQLEWFLAVVGGWWGCCLSM